MAQPLVLYFDQWYICSTSNLVHTPILIGKFPQTIELFRWSCGDKIRWRTLGKCRLALPVKKKYVLTLPCGDIVAVKRGGGGGAPRGCRPSCAAPRCRRRRRGVTSPAPVTGQVKEVSTGSRCTEEVRFLNYTVLLWLWSLVNIFEGARWQAKRGDSWISMFKDPHYFLILEGVFDDGDSAISTCWPSTSLEKKMFISATILIIKSWFAWWCSVCLHLYSDQCYSFYNR